MDNNLAILIDFENIAAGVEKEGLGRFKINLLMDRFKEKGRILVARSYADWGRYAKYKQQLMMAGVSLFELTSHGMQSKNRADVALVVDCMELAFTKPYIDTFVILSGDSDFTPLVLKLKELNKRVIGCGTRRSTSRLIVEACDEFVFYDSLVGARAAHTPPARRDSGGRNGENDNANTITKSEAFSLTIETIEGLQREESAPVHASILKQAMLRKRPAFSGPDLGYSSFTRFLEACRDRGLITLNRDERSGGYFVDLPGEAEADDATPPPQLRDAFEGGALALYGALAEAGLSPLPRDLREQVAVGLVATYQSRRDRKLKCTLRYFHQDVFKRVQGANPALTSGHVKHVIRALHRGGFFVHSNGGPVRTVTAKFSLKSQEPPEILRTLERVYLEAVQGLGLNPEIGDLAEILFGDASAVEAVEALVVSVAEERARAAEEPAVAPEPVEDVMADASDEAPAPDPVEAAPVEEEAASEETAPEAAPEEASEESGGGRRRRRRRRRRPRREESAAVEVDEGAVPVASDEPEAAEAAEATDAAEATSAEAAPAESAEAAEAMEESQAAGEDEAPVVDEVPVVDEAPVGEE